MKAEQRKELETNTLADRMGHVMQRVRSGQRRTIMFYLVIAAALVIGVFLTYRWWMNSKESESERWVRLDDGAKGHMDYLLSKDAATNAGKAARLQIAWMAYWEHGIKRLGSPDEKVRAHAQQLLQDVGVIFRELAKECEGDKLYEPQALYGIAVCEEAKAVQDTKFLNQAAEAYEEVFKKYEKSAEGIKAKQRFDELKDKNKRKEIEDFYKELPMNLLFARATQEVNRPPVPQAIDPKVIKGIPKKGAGK